MTRLHKILLTALLAVCATLLVPDASAQGISISIGDRPYMTRGEVYLDNGYEYYWVPGHWGPRHYWVRGHYSHRRPLLRRLHREHIRVHRAIFGR